MHFFQFVLLPLCSGWIWRGVGATVNPNAWVWQRFLHRRVGSDLAALRGSSCCISDHTCAKGGSNITTGLHNVTRVGVVGMSRG